MERITSPANGRIKDLVRLREGKHRRRQGRFVLEGLRETARALEAGTEVATLFICPELVSDVEAVSPLVDKTMAAQGEVVEVSKSAFSKAALREHPDGVLALARTPDYSLAAVQSALKEMSSPLLLVVERVEKPGNLGALLRTADAAACHAVLVTDPVADPVNPQVIRASQGAVFSLPIAVCSNDDALRFMQDHRIQPVATTPAAEQSHWQADLTGPTAILVGAEDDGLSAFWLEEHPEAAVRIPMAGQSDSLNVSVAAAIVLFEAVRQRS